jgi:hypothetical protein
MEMIYIFEILYAVNCSLCFTLSRFEIFMMVKTDIVIFWGMILCCLVSEYQCFVGTYHPHLLGRSVVGGYQCFGGTLYALL